METASTERGLLPRALAFGDASTTGRLLSAMPGVVAALVVVGLGAAYGGYFATSWGPATAVFLAATIVALVVRPRSTGLGLRSLTIPTLLALLGLWALASSAWGLPSEAVPEAERTLLYASAALACGVVAQRGRTEGIVVGLWAGVSAVCLYALSTRLFPQHLGVFDPIAGYRLSAPVGYWNALGLLASLGMLLALGLAARAEHLLVRLAAAATTVPLALTAYFTFSRGAWLALAAGVVAALALDGRRIQLAATMLVVAPWPALAILLASKSGPLTESGSYTLRAAAQDGRAVTAVGVGLALIAAGVVALLAGLEPRVRLPTMLHRWSAGILVVALVALLAAGTIAIGSPAEISRSFKSSDVPEGSDLNDRLFSISNNGRIRQWRVALREASDHPVVGSGAGSYERHWLEHRTYPGPVQDAHSVYVEMLGELGPIGLALILAIATFPLVLAVRARRRPLVPIAAAALAAYLIHAGIEWDWEFPILTLVAIGCAGVIVAESSERPSSTGRWGRVALLAVLVALIPLVAVNILASRAEAASTEAFNRGDFARAAAEARRAERFHPWSTEPLVLLGRAQAAARDYASAKRTFRRAVAREPEQWRAWLELAAVSTGPSRTAALARARALNPLEHLIVSVGLEQGP